MSTLQCSGAFQSLLNLLPPKPLDVAADGLHLICANRFLFSTRGLRQVRGGTTPLRRCLISCRFHCGSEGADFSRKLGVRFAVWRATVDGRRETEANARLRAFEPPDDKNMKEEEDHGEDHLGGRVPAGSPDLQGKLIDRRAAAEGEARSESAAEKASSQTCEAREVTADLACETNVCKLRL